MKKCFTLFIAILCSLFIEVKAQCDFDDTSPISIGTILVDDAYCPSGGQITVLDVTGGGGQYVYEIISGPVIRIIQSQNVFNALPYGTYRVRVSGCNGEVKEFNRTIMNRYASMNSYYWQQAIVKQSGFSCGITNDGVYKIVKPGFSGGTAPFQFQISASSDFSSSPYSASYDSVTYTGLNASTTYYLRITDACNNFITVNFTTPASTPVVPLSVPSLAFNWGYFYGSCSGNETIFMYFRDSATGNPYTIANAYANKVFWGNAASPYVRIKIEDAISGTVYSDRNVALTYYSGSGNYGFSANTTMNGETGLSAPGTGLTFYSNANETTVIPTIYASNNFPANAQLKVTLFYPGGSNCGTPVPAYSQSFNYNLGTYGASRFLITGLYSNCTGYGNYIKVDYNNAYFTGILKLIDLTAGYNLLKTTTFYANSSLTTSLYYTPLVIGNSYRVILSDTCGRLDSADIVYNPGGSPAPAPVIVDTVITSFKCPVNPLDSAYTIYIKPLPSGYNVTSITLSSPSVTSYYAVSNWNGTSATAYKINQLLPPGTYTYSVAWINSCQTGTVTQTVVIPPAAVSALYTSDMTLSTVTTTAACWQDAYTAIQINGYLKNINTNYSIGSIRLTGVPNDFVFPMNDLGGYTLNSVNSGVYYYAPLSINQYTINSTYSGIKINTGQDGTYTFEMTIMCPDGTIIETITKSITVTATPVVNYFPNLKYATALICDASGSEGRINLLPVGGKPPFHYEYKLATSSVYTATGSGGLDSVVVITPAPAPGTIYDIRVVDACGNTATSKVTTGSFTGRFYIYSYPSDCVNNPFSTRIGTSSINGGYYVWQRNGTIIAQGYNLASITLTGITVDSITVDVNMFDCYSRSVSRTLVAANPCNIVVLPVNMLKFTGNRISSSNVQLNWKTQNEQHTSHFELEKSIDGINFHFLTKVNAYYSMFEHSYSYTDADISALVYYRLKIVDDGGRFSYSNIVKIENKPVVKIAVQAVPNPASDNISLYITSEKPKLYKVNIINENGQTMKSISIAANEIASGKKVDISTLASGNYFISLIDGWEIVASTKFIKQ